MTPKGSYLSAFLFLVNANPTKVNNPLNISNPYPNL